MQSLFRWSICANSSAFFKASIYSRKDFYSIHINHLRLSQSEATFRHYGVSPWEIEVIFDTLRRSFAVLDEPLSQEDPKFVSAVELMLPVQYGEDFFSFFSPESWFKIKGVLKDVKRRRGRKGLRCMFRFAGFQGRDTTGVYFVLDAKSDRHFEMALEKIEYLTDIVPVQLKALPPKAHEVWYSFDETGAKWRPERASEDGKKYAYKNEAWLER